MKEIIYQFSKHNARNAQHVQFATDVLNAVPEETATAQGFASQRAVLATAAADELDCFQPDKGYMDTPEIVSTDRRRDNTFLFYKQLVQAYADYCPDEEKQQAGATVAFAFHEAGNATRQDYASETAILSDLSAKLKQEPYAAALAEIGLSDAPTVIAEANDAFNAVYLKRSAEERDRKLGATMKTLRPVTDDAFNELAKAINALYAANELVTKDAENRGPLPQDYQHRFFGIGGERAGGVMFFSPQITQIKIIIVGAVSKWQLAFILRQPLRCYGYPSPCREGVFH